jgi:hypothetical protein
MIRNCIESDILKALGGTDLQCSGTQLEILNSILVVMGGSPTNQYNRNQLLIDILNTL